VGGPARFLLTVWKVESLMSASRIGLAGSRLRLSALAAVAVSCGFNYSDPDEGGTSPTTGQGGVGSGAAGQAGLAGGQVIASGGDTVPQGGTSPAAGRAGAGSGTAGQAGAGAQVRIAGAGASAVVGGMGASAPRESRSRHASALNNRWTSGPSSRSMAGRRATTARNAASPTTVR
jgi:hypothetical protein